MEKHFAQAPVFESLFFFLPLSEQRERERERERSLTKTSFIIKKRKEKGAGEKHAAESGEIRTEEKEKGIRLPENPACEFKTPYLEAILLYFLFKVHEKKGKKWRPAKLYTLILLC